MVKNTLKKETVFVGVKMPKTLRELIEQHLLKDTHQSLSEFIRDAIRQKIQTEAPQMYNRLFTVEEEIQKI